MMYPQNTAADQQAREQVNQQVRQTVQDAMQAARDAQNAARDAQNQARAAQGVVLVPPVPPFPNYNNDIPPQVEPISIAFFVCCAIMVVGWPIARAFGRRIEGRGTTAAIASPQLTEQLQRIEQAVDAMAIEVERISESQRFMAKLQSQGAERVLK